MKTLRFTLILITLGIVIFSCSKNDDTDDTPACTDVPVVNIGNDTTIPEGGSISLDAGNPGAAFLWSSGETTQVKVVSEPGTYWVQVSLCSSADSDTITIDRIYQTITIETNFGDIRMWLYHDTHLHKANFLDLATQQFYDGLIFHRVVEDFVIQGGDPLGTGYGGPGYTIPAEIMPSLSHVYGAVGAARLATSTESNGSQFYIVSDPDGEPGLDGDYTVFGIVFDGLDVVNVISLVPVNSSQKPIDDVVMNHVTIELYTTQELDDDFGFTVPQ